MKQPMTIWAWGRGVRCRARAVVSLAWLLLACVPVLAQPGPPGQSESDRVVQAHRGVQSAIIDVRFATYYSYPDETEFITTGYRVVFDRPTQRLRIDRPGYTLISDGTDILLIADNLPGRHLRVPLNGALTYERLLEVFPDLGNPTAPAVMMLLANKPMSLLSDGLAEDAAIQPKQTGDTQALQMRLPMQLGSCTLACDDVTRRLNQVQITVDKQHLGNSGVDDVRFHYAIKWSAIDEAVDDALFKLDLKRSHEMTTLAQFLSTGQGGSGAGGAPGGGTAPGGGAGGGAAPTLLGQVLPDLDLAELGKEEPVNLADLDQGVVIVEFFASWTKASTLDLPALADFEAWCAENKHDVTVVAVAVGDQAQTMTKWIDALEKTSKKKIFFPVLLDTTAEAATKVGLPTVPRTLIVVDGRIVDVYGGLKPNFLNDLKKGMPGWQQKAKAEQGQLEKPDTPDVLVAPKEPVEPNPPSEPSELVASESTDDEAQTPGQPAPKPSKPRAPRAPR